MNGDFWYIQEIQLRFMGEIITAKDPPDHEEI